MLVKLLALEPLFNAPKKHGLNFLRLKWMQFVARRHRREQRAHGRRERIFPHVFIYLEKYIIRTYRLPSHVIFYLLQEIKDNSEPSTRSHAKPGLSKRLATLHYLASGSFQRTVASLFATALICATFGISCWSICK